jgi:hypothetical protein
MKHLMFVILIAFLSACNPAMNSFIAARKDDDGSAKKQTNHDDDAERIDIPANISGSYLMCSLREDATETAVASEYGCRLNEAGTNNRLDLGPYQDRVHWQSNEIDGVRITLNSANSVWHALYSVSAANLPALREKVARMQIQVQWSLPNGGTGSTFKDQKLIETLQPATAAGDSSAPILNGQGLDPADPGTL